MNILVIGSGGREHAIAWKVAQSDQVERIWVAPGNGGTALEPKTENINIASDDIPALLAFAEKNNVDLTIVGPEKPLALGLVDCFKKASLPCLGPTQKAARLETSKTYSKRFMREHHIPTADFSEFSHEKEALTYLKNKRFPQVIKADGLAQGKGVIIAENLKEGEEAIKRILSGQAFGRSAGRRIIIEEFLQGEELSFISICDGHNIFPLATSQDHKRRDDGDVGPNTGGMGAYSPVPKFTLQLEKKIINAIMIPTIKALYQKKTPYIGFLYAGLIIDSMGQPKLLEYNCRLGDPETQSIMMRLQSDLVELCFAALNGKLNQYKAAWDIRSALTVVLASGGYPGNFTKGEIISGLDQFSNPHSIDTKVFHAGTRQRQENIVTNGGRVLSVTALGKDLGDAQQRAYQSIKGIYWPNYFYRQDIGWRGIIS